MQANAKSKATNHQSTPERSPKFLPPNPVNSQSAKLSQAGPLRKASVTPVPNRTRATAIRSGETVKSLPDAPATKGLTYHMPKLGKKSSAEQIQKRLQKTSPWFSSIQDPLHGADCKIPDETGVETGVLQIVQRGTVVSPSSGVCGARILSPYINKCQATAYTSGVNIQITTGTVTGTTIAWGDGTNVGDTRGFEFNGSGEIRTITNAHRIVSCALYVQPEPSLSDNKGEICLFQVPFSTETSPNYTDYMNRYKSIIVPVNNNKASRSNWYPFAREDLSFKSFMSTTGEQFADVVSDEIDVPYWNIGFLTSGLAEGVTIRYTVVVNYEFVPKFNTLNVLGASPSPQDVTETDLVENWVQEMPTATVISQKQAASSPSTVSPSHEDDQTGFGMFFNVVKELAPIALALL